MTRESISQMYHSLSFIALVAWGIAAVINVRGREFYEREITNEAMGPHGARSGPNWTTDRR